MMRIQVVPLLSLLVITGCGGGDGGTHLTNPQVSGAYEFIVTSNFTGGTTLVEVNLSANGNQSSASGPNQVQILGKEGKNWYVNGVCYGNTPGQNGVSATVGGSDIAVTFDVGGNTFGGQGVITGTSIVGNYALSGSNCPSLQNIIGVPPGTDSGGFTANQVPNLEGSFSGPLNLPGGTDNAVLLIAEDSNHGLTVDATLAGPADQGSFTLSGSAVGNAMFVSGTISGRPASWLGYFDRSGRFTGMPNSIQVFDYDTLTSIGLLIKQ